MDYGIIADRLSKRKVVVLDGATGTEVYRRRVLHDPLLPWGVNGLLHRPDVVKQIHYDYFVSGANVVTTNCFYTTKYALQRYAGFGNSTLSEMSKSLTYLGVLLCKDAERLAHKKGVKHPTCVAGNVAPIEPDNPYDRMTAKPKYLAISEHSEKIRNLIEAGVDLILIETMSTLYEAEAALEAYDEAGGKMPFWISFSCDQMGILHGKETMEQVIDLVESYSPDILSINCTPPEGITRALEQLRGKTEIPLGAYANVEAPVYEESIPLCKYSQPVYRRSESWKRRPDISPEEYVKFCQQWWKLGARMIGGCCGTTPEDISEVARAFDSMR